MDLVTLVSMILGIACIIIGALLLPLSGWFLWHWIKNKTISFIVIAALVLALAAASFIGAYNMFTTGIIKQALI